MTELFWNQHAGWPILGTLQLLPLLGAALLMKLGETAVAAWIGRCIAGLELGLVIFMYSQFDISNSAYQFAERFDLLGPLSYHVGADGVTVLFMLLGAFIVFLLSLYCMVRDLAQGVRLLAVLLAIEGLMMSLLCTFNLLAFVIASGFEMALAGYLIGHWSTSPDKKAAVSRFYQFQSVGLLMLLTGTLTLGWVQHDLTGAPISFDLLDLAGLPMPANLAAIIFLLLFYGLGVRTPIFPLHGWLPGVARHGNVAIAPALLLGVKVGIYGQVRFVMPLLPEAVQTWAPYVVGFAAAGVFYAALLAFQQTNLRRLIAFAVVSHTSLVVVGLFALDAVAFQGALLMAVNFGLATTAMLLMTGFIYRRTRSTNLDKLGGLFDRMPIIGMTYFVAGLAIVGMPGTPGFDAAHLVLEAAIHRFGALPAVAAALGNVAAAGFLLWAFQRAFLAPAPAGRGSAVERANSLEWFISTSLIALILIAGFHISPWLDLIEAPMQALATRFNHD